MNEPIAAIATSTATDAALSVIRVSGEGCRQLLCRCLRKNNLSIDTAPVPDRRVILCDFVDPNTLEILDRVTAIFYQAPKSYTGEDSAEIICHGGRALTRQIFRTLTAAGFSAATGGDFTRRAFLNGKMDLAQAESVAAATSASSVTAAKAAARGLSGETSERLNALSNQLVELLSLLEANLDLSEEGIDVVDPGRILFVLQETDACLSELLRHAKRAELLSGAVRVSLIGKPNVGKSTLLNRLLGSERAIVSPTPGTTRDVIDGAAEIDGVGFEFLDTAGIRSSKDSIESEGVERSLRAAETSNLILFVMDASSIDAEDIQIAQSLPKSAAHLFVLNKTDLAGPDPDILEPFQNQGQLFTALIPTVARTGDGVEALRAAISRQARLILGDMGEMPVFVSARQAECLNRAKAAVERAKAAAENSDLTEEFLSADIREALDALADFAGRKTADHILDKIFSNFCVGK